MTDYSIKAPVLTASREWSIVKKMALYNQFTEQNLNLSEIIQYKSE